MKLAVEVQLPFRGLGSPQTSKSSLGVCLQCFTVSADCQSVVTEIVAVSFLHITGCLCLISTFIISFFYVVIF